MNCDDMVKSIPLYFYGELPPEEEERVEDHLDCVRAVPRRIGAAAHGGRGARPARDGSARPPAGRMPRRI